MVSVNIHARSSIYRIVIASCMYLTQYKYENRYIGHVITYVLRDGSTWHVFIVMENYKTSAIANIFNSFLAVLHNLFLFPNVLLVVCVAITFYFSTKIIFVFHFIGSLRTCARDNIQTEMRFFLLNLLKPRFFSLSLFILLLLFGLLHRFEYRLQSIICRWPLF